MIIEFDDVGQIKKFLKSLNPCQENGGECIYEDEACGYSCQVHTLKQYVKKTELEKLKADFEAYHSKYPVAWKVCGYVRAMERTIRNKK